MSNSLECKDCTNYYAQRRAVTSGKLRDLNYGHCLAKSKYAKNKPGNPVYPPGAVVVDLPYNVHDIHIVSPTDIHAGCTSVKKR